MFSSYVAVRDKTEQRVGSSTALPLTHADAKYDTPQHRRVNGFLGVAQESSNGISSLTRWDDLLTASGSCTGEQPRDVEDGVASAGGGAGGRSMYDIFSYIHYFH